MWKSASPPIRTLLRMPSGKSNLSPVPAEQHQTGPKATGWMCAGITAHRSLRQCPKFLAATRVCSTCSDCPGTSGAVRQTPHRSARSDPTQGRTSRTRVACRVERRQARSSNPCFGVFHSCLSPSMFTQMLTLRTCADVFDFCCEMDSRILNRWTPPVCGPFVKCCHTIVPMRRWSCAGRAGLSYVGSIFCSAAATARACSFVRVILPASPDSRYRPIVPSGEAIAQIRSVAAPRRIGSSSMPAF